MTKKEQDDLDVKEIAKKNKVNLSFYYDFAFCVKVKTVINAIIEANEAGLNGKKLLTIGGDLRYDDKFELEFVPKARD